MLVLNSFSDAPVEIRFAAGGGEGSDLLVNILSDDHSRADTSGRHSIVLEPYGYRWFRLGGLDYILRRREV